MIAYKLIRKMKNGYAPLFINKRQRLAIGVIYKAESHETKGFSYRPGWHCLSKPEAPHLSKKDRVWVKVEINDFQVFYRPQSQGGKWYLAKEMKILEELNEKHNAIEI